jgi:hypothetical protein
MYCALCGRPVEATRHIGAGTIFFAIITGGLSLLAVPFYAKRCAICRSTAVSLTPPEGTGGGAGASFPARLAELEKRLRLVEEELESAGVDLNRLKTERDFYRELLGDPTSRRGTTSGG